MAYDMPLIDTALPAVSGVNGRRRDLSAIDRGLFCAASTRLRRGPSPQAVAAAMTAGTRFRSAREQLDFLADRNACLERQVAQLTHQELQARYLALHDSLTGLPNRRLLEDRFRQAMAAAIRHHESLALLVLDIDDFKWINDRLGHAVGDKILVSVMQRLTAGIRGMDTACRYGGDEFVLLLPEIGHPKTATDVAAKVRLRLAVPYFTGGYQIHISVSVGTAVYPFDGVDYEELLNHADGAMYRSKPSHTTRKTSILIPHGHNTSLAADAEGLAFDNEAGPLVRRSFFD